MSAPVLSRLWYVMFVTIVPFVPFVPLVPLVPLVTGVVPVALEVPFLYDAALE